MSQFEKGEYKKGQMLDLTLVEEIEKENDYGEKNELRILLDDKDRTHTVKKSAFKFTIKVDKS